MGQFEVNIYYHGCFNRVVEAENEDEAKEKAYKEAETMDEKEFLRDICIEINGQVVYELKK